MDSPLLCGKQRVKKMTPCTLLYVLVTYLSKMFPKTQAGSSTSVLCVW